MKGLIDIGANLAHDSFDADRDAVLERAWDAGLEVIIITGSSADSARRALALAQAHGSCGRGRLYSTAGLHPHHASDWNAELAALFRELAAAPQVVSLGECGLDYNRNYSPHEDQRRAFIAQLQLAIELNKPLFLHQRDAHADFIAILREHRAALDEICVHCFTDTREALEDCLALDCHIGITGWICDERRGRHLLEIVGLIPNERLMIETDAPYLLPRTAPRHKSAAEGGRPASLAHAVGEGGTVHGVDGGVRASSNNRRNEPCYLPWVVRSIAAARGQSDATVAAASATTARRFFRLPQ